MLKYFCSALVLTSLFAAPAFGQAPENPLGIKVHHITASATDVDRAVKWYQEMLGFKLDQRGNRNNGASQFAELSIPGFGVGLTQQGARGGRAGTTPTATPATPPPTAGPAGPPSGNRWVHIVFAVADPAKTFAILKERGANPRTRAAAGSPITTFLVNDSEGNEIEFVSTEPAPAAR